MELSWEPCRTGPIYCSAACGHGCKQVDFDKATLDANALCKKLGKGWAPRVWENLGWHWEVSNGEVRVMPPKYGSKLYSATYDNTVWTKAKTGRQAVKLLLEEYKAKAKEVGAARAKIKNVFMNMWV